MENLSFYIEIYELDEQTPDHPEILSILSCISENYSNEQMSVDIVAEKVGKSRTQIYHYCDIGLGLTPSEIMHIFRALGALKLFRNTNDNLKIIKKKCGYSTSKTFNMNIKKLLQKNASLICSDIRCEVNGNANYQKYFNILLEKFNIQFKKPYDLTVQNDRTK